MLAGLLLAAEMARKQGELHAKRAEHLRMMCRPGDELAQAAADALRGLATQLQRRADGEDTGELEVISIEPEGPPPIPRAAWWRRALRYLSQI